MQHTNGRPAGAFSLCAQHGHTHGGKSRHRQVTANEVERNCMGATERGEEAWSVNRASMDKNRIEGAAEQGERAKNREALVTRAKRCRCGGRAMKECVLIRWEGPVRLPTPPIPITPTAAYGTSHNATA